jgi:heme/copper-type cytochrome/quinol oxidase subunit 3
MAGDADQPGTVIEFRSPRAREEFTSYVAMVIFLGAWAMLFCGLFMTYALLRSRAPAWPPAGEPVMGLSLPILVTVLMLGSSSILHLGYRALRGRNQASAFSMVLMATALGLGMLGAQYAICRELWHQGLRPWSSPYGSLLYTMTGIHAAHAVVGLGALVWLSSKIRSGLINAARLLPLRLWGLYWHFLGLVWVMLFFVVFAL